MIRVIYDDDHVSDYDGDWFEVSDNKILKIFSEKPYYSLVRAIKNWEHAFILEAKSNG